MTNQPDLVFYHRSPSRAQTVRWMLEELDEPYETRLVDFEKDENHAPDFLALNPMGKVPVITHNGIPVSETAAICAYLADAFPGAGLNVPIGDPHRGPYMRWLFFGPSCFEPAVFEHLMPREGTSPSSVGWGSYELVIDAIETGLKPGPYLMGEQFTAADVVIGAGLRWARMMKLLPGRPAFDAYIAALESRPALQRSEAKDIEIAIP